MLEENSDWIQIQKFGQHAKDKRQEHLAQFHSAFFQPYPTASTLLEIKFVEENWIICSSMFKQNATKLKLWNEKYCLRNKIARPPSVDEKPQIEMSVAWRFSWLKSNALHSITISRHFSNTYNPYPILTSLSFIINNW